MVPGRRLPRLPSARPTRRRRPPVIAILGVDGSGKTTQARLLAERLRRDGIGASYFENAGGRPVTDWIAHRLGRADGRALFSPTGIVVIESTLRWLAVGRALGLSRVTGRVAVMDRYGYCQQALMRARGDHGAGLVRLAFLPFGAPDLVVFLAVDVAQAQERVELRGYDREELAYLEAFAAAYASLPESEAFVALDASGSIDEVHERIHGIIAPLLGRGR
ncbi:MAG: hypothetical protein AAGC46_09250 [Solirubrobacteraceae bacterium]|nr:hypothetical protein [Patulibacter sp.]